LLRLAASWVGWAARLYITNKRQTGFGNTRTLKESLVVWNLNAPFGLGLQFNGVARTFLVPFEG
jgi:hypothetical protein